MDITFLGAGNPPGGFPLDNISGTIYAAGPRADFENALFGTPAPTVRLDAPVVIRSTTI